MIELPEDVLPTQDLVLLPDDSTRGADDGERPQPLSGRIALNGPGIRRLNATVLGLQSRELLISELETDQYDYYLVWVSVTFLPVYNRAPLEFTRISLSLKSEPEFPNPIAHAMAPMRVLDPVEISQVRRFGPQLSILGADASLGEIGKTIKYTSSQPYVEALGLQGAVPAWEFRRTRSHDLFGCHRLDLVVRTAAGAITDANFTVTAGVKMPILRRFTRQLPNPLRLEATL
ncbi:hypothetical protein [Nocardia sp. NPDC023988]|uniref:hypothetical protein n=1 Tax=unclassified Nocardia TaxID=2637762 RepID=UPI0033CE85EB